MPPTSAGRCPQCPMSLFLRLVGSCLDDIADGRQLPTMSLMKCHRWIVPEEGDTLKTFRKDSGTANAGSGQC